MDVEQLCQKAKSASEHMAKATTAQKNRAIEKMIELLETRGEEILEANKKDLEEARESGLSQKVVNRLVFDQGKLDWRVRSLKKLVELPDPVGQKIHTQKRPNELMVAKVRAPLGVIAMIYEARPHVTVNAGAFCIKSSNAAILKGGSEVKHSNQVIGEFWQEALQEAGLPGDTVQVVSLSHEEVSQLLKKDQYLSLIIPRGGKGLIRAVTEQSRIPVVKHEEGICHVYVEGTADMEDAVKVTLDSKLLMPEVCNAAETLLVDDGVAEDFLPGMAEAFRGAGVTMKGDARAREIVSMEEATEEDWRTEYLDKIISIRVVKDEKEAIEHINSYGSHHTDTIMSQNFRKINRFLKEVDSGVVLVNASTMFDDGEELGIGAEIGISTNKLHARGPMGMEDLTIYKWTVIGDGHVKGG